MSNTAKMLWPYPTKDSDPWFTGFESMTGAMDASGYAAREDRNVLLSAGGTVSFTASSGLLSWSAGLVLLSTISGYKLTLPAGSVILADGACLYVNVTRSPTGNVSVSSFAAAQVPNTDSAMLIAVRSGTSVFFKNGVAVASGVPTPLFNANGLPSGSTLIEVVKLATRESHDSITPLVAGGDSFNPPAFDKPQFTKSMVFRVVAANGDIGLNNTVQLYNLTDNDPIVTLTFTSTTLTKQEAVLVQGTGPGQVDPLDKIYEVRMALGVPSGGPTHTVELFAAEIIVTSTAI